MRKILGYKSRSENPQRFYLWFAVLSIFVWVMAGLISFLPLTGIPEFLIRMVVGLAPCAIFLFSILTWLEIKRKTQLNEKFQKIEDSILILFAFLSVFAEIIFQTSGGLSYALPMTIASLSVVGIVRTVPPKNESGASSFINKRFSSMQIIKIIVFGALASVIFANFISATSNFVEKILS